MLGRSRGVRRTARALAGLVLAAGLVALAAPAADTASTAVVSVVLDEWTLMPSQAATRPGRVSFVVRNDGTMPHEFVVLRSERHHHRLALKGGKAVEMGRVGEIAQIPVGVAKRLTMKLPAGKYVLICNILGHYQAGQYAALRVR